MSAVDRIEELLGVLRDSLALLQAAQAEGVAAFAADPWRWAGLQHAVQITLQACADIGDRVLDAEGLDEPARSRDVFPALAGAGLLPDEVARRLAELVGYRNLLVHNYMRITPEGLAARLPDVLTAAEAFANAIAAWMRR